MNYYRNQRKDGKWHFVVEGENLQVGFVNIMRKSGRHAGTESNRYLYWIDNKGFGHLEPHTDEDEPLQVETNVNEPLKVDPDEVFNPNEVKDFLKSISVG